MSQVGDTYSVLLAVLLFLMSCSTKPEAAKEPVTVVAVSRHELLGTWISHTKDGFTMLELKPDSQAHYTSYLIRDRMPPDSIDVYYTSLDCEWGMWNKRVGYVADTNQIKKEDFFWVKTNKFRFDYRIENGKLIEFDKMGAQGIFRKAVNEKE